METAAKIRRRHLVDGEKISALCRELTLSRNTVKKYLHQTEVPVYRRRVQPKPKFGEYEELLERWLEQDAQRPKRQRRTARRLFEDLQAAGYAGAYDSVQRAVKAWSYSVPAEYAGQRVSLRASAERIVVVADGEQIAVHARSVARGRLVLDPWHYLPLLERKPGALRNGAPFVTLALPAPIAAVKDQLLQQPKGDRAFVEILLALREHGSELVTVACELALEHRTVSAAVVLNHVHRLKAPPPPAPLPVSEHLRLACEPQADCARYDQLRAGARGGEA